MDCFKTVEISQNFVEKNSSRMKAHHIANLKACESLFNNALEQQLYYLLSVCRY